MLVQQAPCCHQILEIPVQSSSHPPLDTHINGGGINGGINGRHFSSSSTNPLWRHVRFRFGYVAPIRNGTVPWMLGIREGWDLEKWLSTEGGRQKLMYTQRLGLELCEEFLFDTLTAEQQAEREAVIRDTEENLDLTGWSTKLPALRSALTNRVSVEELELIDIHVNGLGETSSMSDYVLGPENPGEGLLRPTQKVYEHFIDEFTNFRPGEVKRVRLSGIFPGDWADIIRRRLECEVEKDLRCIASELKMYTDPPVDCSDLFEQYGPAGPGDDWEDNWLRKEHRRAVQTMVGGAGASNLGDDDEEMGDDGELYDADLPVF